MNAVLKPEPARLKAAIYARYSTELQSKDSIADQTRSCEVLAERHNLEVVERYSDPAISGGTTSRPGYQDLLRGAREGRFQIILAEDCSRLWRHMGEQWRAMGELLDLGVHLITHDVDTRAENFKLLLAMHGALAEVYRDQIRYRTRRGLRGKVARGQSAGGHRYGYKSERNAAGEKVLVIDEEEAAIVRQIFEWRAAGWTPTRICRELNKRLEETGSPKPPGAHWQPKYSTRRKNTKPAWVVNAIAPMLENILYKGWVIWGARTTKISATDSKKATVVPGDPHNRVEKYHPKLRIISDAVWDAAQAAKMLSTVPRTHQTTVSRFAFPLSGTLKCGRCGSSYVAYGPYDFACLTHTNGGCDNNLRFRRDAVHQQVLDLLLPRLLDPERIARGKARVEAYLQQQAREEARRGRSDLDRSADLQRLDQQAAALRNMTLAPSALTAALAAIDGERREIIARATSAATGRQNRAARLLARIDELVAGYRLKLQAGFKGLANRGTIEDAALAVRALLHDGTITLNPSADRTCVQGVVHFKDLGQHAIETLAWERQSRAFNKGKAGCGICCNTGTGAP